MNANLFVIKLQQDKLIKCIINHPVTLLKLKIGFLLQLLPQFIPMYLIRYVRWCTTWGCFVENSYGILLQSLFIGLLRLKNVIFFSRYSPVVAALQSCKCLVSGFHSPRDLTIPVLLSAYMDCFQLTPYKLLALTLNFLLLVTNMLGLYYYQSNQCGAFI